MYALWKIRLIATIIIAMLTLGNTGPRTASAADAFLPLDLRQVKVRGEIGRRIDVTCNNNLLVLKIDEDFLVPFQKKAAHEGYVGLGKTIEASVRLAANTKSEKLLALKKRLVDEAIKTQSPDGYIGIMAEDARMWSMWDIHEMGYVILGLTTDYHYFGEKRSLEAAVKLADFVVQRWATMPSDWPQQTRYVPDFSTMGLDRALVALYHETGEQRFLDFCLKERALLTWNLGIVIGRRLLMEGDASAYMAKCLAQLELHQLQPNARLLPQSQRLIRFLAAGNGMCIDGGVGQWEVFTDDQDGRGKPGRNVRDGLSASPVRHDVADRRQSRLRRPHGANDPQRVVCGSIARRPPAPLLHTHGRQAGVFSRRHLLLPLQLSSGDFRVARDDLLPIEARSGRQSVHNVGGDLPARRRRFVGDSARNHLSHVGPRRVPRRSVEAHPVPAPIADSPLV